MLATQLLACAFDPTKILHLQGISPDPWQCDLLLAPPAYTLLNCSRQVGKSTMVAALALHRALFFPQALVLLLSPSLRQSSEIFRKLVSQYEPFRAVVPCKRQTKSLLELNNGARVLSLPGREQFLRSFGGVTLLVLDEAARIPDALYHSVRPMLAVSGGNLIALSTPFGKRGWFHDAWIGKEPWRRVEIPWNLCPRISPAFIQSEIASMGQAWVNQEYCCSFH
ncbi:MAG: terminase large subunit domain-containing protein, partial [Planctomycetia bacterium]